MKLNRSLRFRSSSWSNILSEAREQMHKWWGNGWSGVLTQTIWSTLTLATQINTLNTQTEDGTEETTQTQNQTAYSDRTK